MPCGRRFAKPAQAVDKIPARYREELQSEMEASLEKARQLQEEIIGLAGERQNLRFVSDYYRIRAEKYEVLGRLPQTANTFAMSGYVPAKDADQIVRSCRKISTRRLSWSRFMRTRKRRYF